MLITQNKIADAYQAAQALQPHVDSVKRGATKEVKALIDYCIQLRPAQWWTPLYIETLRVLCENMVLLSTYSSNEMKASQEGDIKMAERWNKLVCMKVAAVRQLQANLQITPTMLNGKAWQQEGRTIAHQMAKEILDDVDTLYAQ
jgi:hypothetical protein